MKNLATLHKTDITISENGEGYISQRKTSEVTGIPLSTLNRWVLENGTPENVNENNQLNHILFNKMVVMGQRKGHEKCFDVAEQLLEAGAKAYIYHLAGYEMQASKPMTQLEMIAATALALNEANQKIEQLQIDVKSIQAKQSAMGDNYGFYSVLGYANTKKLRLTTQEAAAIGRQATVLSKRDGVQMGSVPDARWGSVKTYHEDILAECF